MPRDIAPLTSALTDTTPGQSSDVARCVIRTRIRDDIDAIPRWALEYLADITVDDSSPFDLERAANEFGPATDA